MFLNSNVVENVVSNRKVRHLVVTSEHRQYLQLIQLIDLIFFAVEWFGSWITPTIFGYHLRYRYHCIFVFWTNFCNTFNL